MPRRALPWLVSITVVVLTLFVGNISTAGAHAALVRSTPASQAELTGGPASIDLWFTEPLEGEFSSFELYGSDGQQQAIDNIRVDPADPRHLSGVPRELPPDLYTVTYLTLSTLDGHEWRGSFSFAVLDKNGNIPSGAAYQPDLSSGSSTESMFARWFTFVGLAGVVGATFLAVLISRVRGRDPRLDALGRVLAARLALAMVPLIVVGGLLQLLSQHDAVGGSMSSLLTESRFGTYWLWRQLLVLALFLLVGLTFLAQHRDRNRVELYLLIGSGLSASAALWTVSMLSHAAAAPGRFWAVLADFVHLEVAALWAGGLAAVAALAFVARRGQRSPTLLPVLIQFSVLAAAGMYVLLVTGVVRALGQLPTADAVTGTEYGRWLIVKIALLVVTLSLAFANRRFIRDLGSGKVRSGLARSRLKWFLPAEALMSIALLLSVAFLGQTPTVQRDDSARVSAVPGGFTGVGNAGDLQVHLQVTPAKVGPNEVRAHIYRSDGADPGTFQRVRVTLAGGGATGGDSVEAVAEGNGTFVVAGLLLSRPETQPVTIDVQREGQDDARFQFELPVAAAPVRDEPSMFSSPAPQLTKGSVFALALIAIGLAPLLWWRRSRRGFGATARAFGAILVFASGLVLLSVGSPLEGKSYPATPEAISRGAIVYAANCASCHGETGRGEGPAGIALRPPPADLTFHLPLHVNEGIDLFIANGAPGTAMPGWKDVLTEEQIWDVIHYMRAEFAQGVAPEGVP